MGSLVVELKADLARLQTDMNRGVGVVEKAALGITKAAGVAKAALAGIAGGLTAGAFASTIKQAIDFGDSLRDTARAAGQTVEQMAFLDYAATQSGTSIQSLTTVTAKLQKTLSEVVKGGNQKATSAIKQLGLDAQELARSDFISQISTIGDALSGVANASERAQLGQDIFGKSFRANASLILEGSKGIGSLADNFARLGGTITGEQANRFDEINDALGDLRVKGQAAAITVSDALGPAIIDFANGVINIIPFVADTLEDFGRNVLYSFAELEKNVFEFKAKIDGILFNPANTRGRGAGQSTVSKQVQADLDAVKLAQGKMDAIRDEQQRREIERFERAGKIRKAIAGTGNAAGVSTEGGEADTKAQQEAARRAEREADAITQLKLRLVTERDVTEAAKVRFQIEEGAYKDFSAATKDRLKALAAELDIQEDLADIAKESVEVQEYLRGVEKSRRQEAARASEALNQERNATIKSLRSPEEAYADEVRRLLTLNLDENNLQRGITKAREQLDAAREKANEASDAVRALGLTFTSAFEDAVLEGEKLSGVLDGLAKDIARLLLRRTVTEPLFGGDNKPGLLDGLFKAGGDFFKGLFANSRGGLYKVAGGGGERPVAFTARAGEIVAVGAGAQAAGGAPIINLIGAPQPKSTSSRVVNGRWVTDMIFTEAAGSAAGQGLLRPLGISPPMVAR